MDSDELEQAAIRLQAEKRKLTGMIEKIEESGINHELGDSTGELSAYDNHPADLGSEVFERSKDIALRDNENILVAAIEHALKNIKEGSYGQCEVCGSVIPAPRLKALPWATTCVDCQQKLDSHDISKRPVEEYSLQPPFGRTFLDQDSKQNVGFDGEDSLQAVWQYGSSDSPQDLPGSDDYENLNIDPDERIGVVDPADAIPASIDGSHDQTAQINRESLRKRMSRKI
jgi:YteA family regulatory protein